MTNQNKLASMDAVGELPDFGNLLLREDNYPHLPSGKTKYKMTRIASDADCLGCAAEFDGRLCDSLPNCVISNRSYIFEVQP